MEILVLAPQRLGIREVAERVGSEWEAMCHDVEYAVLQLGKNQESAGWSASRTRYSSTGPLS